MCFESFTLLPLTSESAHAVQSAELLLPGAELRCLGSDFSGSPSALKGQVGCLFYVFVYRIRLHLSIYLPNRKVFLASPFLFGALETP